MANKLNNKELEQANGGEYSTYWGYTFYWSCAEDNIFDQYECKWGFTYSTVTAAMNARIEEIKSQHAGKTVTVRDKQTKDRTIQGTRKY